MRFRSFNRILRKNILKNCKYMKKKIIYDLLCRCLSHKIKKKLKNLKYKKKKRFTFLFQKNLAKTKRHLYLF